MKVIQIGSLFYGCIVNGEKIDVLTIGYPTYEQCFSMIGMTSIEG